MNDESKAAHARMLLQAATTGFLINSVIVCDCGEDTFYVGMLATEHEDFIRFLMCSNCMEVRHLPFKRKPQIIQENPDARTDDFHPEDNQPYFGDEGGSDQNG